MHLHLVHLVFRRTYINEASPFLCSFLFILFSYSPYSVLMKLIFIIKEYMFLLGLFSIFVLGMYTHSLPLTESQILRYFLLAHGWHTPGFVWHSLLSADGPICVIDFSWVKRDDWHRMIHVVAQSSLLTINTPHKQQPKVSHFRLYYVWFSWLCLYLPSRFYTVTSFVLSTG